jgi:hypothetical protein
MSRLPIGPGEEARLLLNTDGDGGPAFQDDTATTCAPACQLRAVTRRIAIAANAWQGQLSFASEFERGEGRAR